MKDNRSENNKMKYKVVIIDDHPIVRQGLAMMIDQENDLRVCGDASDIPSALEAVREHSPDIAVVDISLGQSSGLNLIEDLTRQYPGLSILALSMHDETLYAERCLRAGAKGYIMKKEPPEKVIVAIKDILNGGIYVSNNLGSKLLHKLVAKKSGAADTGVNVLSNRELEVFRLIGQGLKTGKIAEQLNLSVKTIETYIDHIKKKMHFKDSRELFLNAVQWHINEGLPAESLK